MDTRGIVQRAIKEHSLDDWLSDYPWLIGALGDPNASFWFLGENPSMRGVLQVHERARVHDANLQWNSHAGDWLFRQAIVDAGLKEGPPETNTGWRCFITNVIKAPEVVGARNGKKQRSEYWREQARIWMPVLQAQLDGGSPKVVICLGKEVKKILTHMISLGLKCPPIETIHHYSYIMLRPESKTKRGPRHPDRIHEFKVSIANIVEKYGSPSLK